MIKRVKNSKKGFTLVEVIVVLVILAILAAISIPALTGYIDEAKDKQLISETRNIAVAMQTILDKQYAKGSLEPKNLRTAFGMDPTGKLNDTSGISKLLGQTPAGLIKGFKYIPETAKLTEFEYRLPPKICRYENGVFTVETRLS